MAQAIIKNSETIMALIFQWHKALVEIEREAWQRLARPYGFPFLDWDWLNLLETSGCVGGKTGWLPMHLSVHRDNRLVAAAPLYIKFHSRGEFVFDHPIADVSAQLCIPYYPKLLGMSPFTPATGYRFLIDPAEKELVLCRLILKKINTLCRQQGISGCHFLRVDAGWGKKMTALGMSPWLHHALIWENQNHGDFDDYLATFKSKRRKSIRRERGKITERAIRLVTVPGHEAPEAWFSLMYDYYATTCRKFLNWSRYLNRHFFQGLSKDLASYIVFMAAFEESGEKEPIALSMLVRQGGQLYGRYWGSKEHFDHLHFEACYYQPIQWAITNNIHLFDAGSGNAEHKHQRGFLARPTYSLHHFYEPVINEIWQANINNINQMEQKYIDAINV